MTRDVAFIDIETLGLDPDRHAIWEIAVIVDGNEHCWQQRVSRPELLRADPLAQELTHFAERYHQGTALSPLASIRMFSDLVEGRHLVGAIPSFDEERLRRQYVRLVGRPDRFPWHYHILDVEAMAVGYLAAKHEPVWLPWKSHELSERLGVPEVEHAHTALGDARWAKAMWTAMIGPA